jgi:type IV pilus assembly protein PilN
MIRINLLPFRAARKKENIRRQVSIFLLSVVLVLIVAAWFNYLLSSKINALNKQILATQAQVDKYNKINQEIAEIKKKLDLLNKKIEVIRSLDLTRKAPVELLDDMSRLNVEKRMWLTGLEEKSGMIKVVGVAVDNPTIAEYMTRIETSQKYVAVKLLSINQDNSIPGLNLKTFGISFRKKPLKSQTEPIKKQRK